MFILVKLYVLEVHENHNSLGCEQLSDLDVNQSLIVQDMFQPIPGLISCVGVTGSVGITCHAHATQMAGLRSPLMPAATRYVPVQETCTKNMANMFSCISMIFSSNFLLLHMFSTLNIIIRQIELKLKVKTEISLCVAIMQHNKTRPGMR